MMSSLRALCSTALIAAALTGIGPASASSARATEEPRPGGGTQVHLPSRPQCFGEPATIVMATPGDQLGTSGDDVIIGTSGNDYIDSLGGHDRICAGDGGDVVSADFDPVTGDWDPQISVIGEGASADDDYIDGQGDGDVITPGAGNDHVWGSDGSDYLYGQLGDDTIFGGDNQDWMDCDGGIDWADGGRGPNDWVNAAHGCETLISAAP
jgi:Ca2+-binding RTX toxin-like protein